MTALSSKLATALFALGALVLSATVPMEVRAQAPAVDPAATKILKRMTDYLGSLKQFSVHTASNLEDLIPSGQRIDASVAASVTVSRPNKLRAERRGDLVDQNFYYDGKTMTLYNPSDKVYATEPAPGTLEGMLDYIVGTLGLGIPAGDLVYANAYALLTKDLTFAAVLGKAVAGGVKCDHLLFSRPGVDMQVWIAESGRPLPYKYVVTDRATPERLSIVTLMSKWNVEPKVADSSFTFVPPKGARPITFMRLDGSISSSR
jgi:hypothetical protein